LYAEGTKMVPVDRHAVTPF